MAEWNPIKLGIGVGVGLLFLLVIIGAGFHVVQFNLDKFSPQLFKYLFYGAEDTQNIGVTTVSGDVGGIITALMVWLIIFVAFGDILENFSAFSAGIGWIVAFAIAVVAANVGIIQSGIIYLVGLFAWAGTVSVFLALLAAFFFFFLVNWGVTGLSGWIKRRQEMVKAYSGKTKLRVGVEALGTVARATEREGS